MNKTLLKEIFKYEFPHLDWKRICTIGRVQLRLKISKNFMAKRNGLRKARSIKGVSRVYLHASKNNTELVIILSKHFFNDW